MRPVPEKQKFVRSEWWRKNWEGDHARPGSVAMAQQAAEQALAMGKPSLAFDFLGIAVWCQAMLGQQTQALNALDARRDWVLSEGTALDKANFHRLRSGVLAMADQLQASIAEARLALAAMRASGYHTHILAVLNNMALALYWRGELDSAERIFTEAVQLRDRWHGPTISIFDLHLGSLLCARGDYGQAEQLLLRAVDALRGPNVQVLGSARSNLVAAENYLAALWLALGQPKRALALLEGDDTDLAPGARWRRLILRLRTARFEGRVDPSLLVLAQAKLAQPDGSVNQTILELELPCGLAADQALQVHLRLLGSPVVRERPGLLMHVAARAAQAELSMGHCTAAVSHTALALPLLADFAPYDIERSEVWLALAQVLQANGDAAAAASLLDTGAAWLQGTCQERVAAPWRVSFLQTHVANRRFMELTLGASQASKVGRSRKR